MKKIYLNLSSVVLLITLISCTEESTYENDEATPNSSNEASQQITEQENFISFEKAKDIGHKISIFSKYNDITGKWKEKSHRTVKTLNEVKNKNKVAALYIINYDEGGWVLLSADKRTDPILAYSDDNQFLVEESQYPEGLKFWMKETKNEIAELQNSIIEQSERSKRVWESVQEEFGLTKKEDPVECYDHTVMIQEGPLLNTTWGQQGGL